MLLAEQLPSVGVLLLLQFHCWKPRGVVLGGAVAAVVGGMALLLLLGVVQLPR